ncbi:MAG TPA: HD domain-containing phosphohydrolase [Myxococcales bacterium]|nr:HD domain-containing phosphohydrolase [Myxococcales bacterium]
MPHSVLLSGDREFRAVVAAALGDGYGIVEVDTVQAAADALLAGRPSIAFVDMRGKSEVGQAVCRRIKGAASTRLLQVIGCADAGEEALVGALDAGADHVMAFPPPVAELHARMRAATRTRLATERLEDTSQVIFALANAVEAKDAYTEGHTERVGALAVECGRLAGLDEETREALRQGGVLHDIGKIGIPNEIINKAGLLTPKERIVMNKHPIIGERICEPLKSLRQLLPIIRWHHEKLDGTGYPDGLKGTQFPVPAQVLQLADIYDAITTDRPYHRARTRASAVEFLHMEAGKGWRDHELVNLLALAAEKVNLGRTRDEDIPPPPAPIGQWRWE